MPSIVAIFVLCGTVDQSIPSGNQCRRGIHIGLTWFKVYNATWYSEYMAMVLLSLFSLKDETKPMGFLFHEFCKNKLYVVQVHSAERALGRHTRTKDVDIEVTCKG